MSKRYLSADDQPRSIYEREKTPRERKVPLIRYVDLPASLKPLRLIIDPEDGMEAVPRYRVERAEAARVALRKASIKRRIQAQKKEVADRYEPGTYGGKPLVEAMRYIRKHGNCIRCTRGRL